MARPVLIIGAWVRHLAEAADRAGFQALSADLFGDPETAAASHAARRIAGDPGAPIGLEAALDALDALAAEADETPIGVVTGTGFEGRPEVVRRLAEAWPLLGAPAEAVALARAERLFPLLTRLQVPHPEFRVRAPEDPTGWLAKRYDGAGGGHVAPARAGGGAGVYYQARVAGPVVSAQLLCGAREARVYGLTQNWTAPAPGAPYRFGGVVRPAPLAPLMAAEIADIASLVGLGVGLRGLCGVDLVVGAEGPQVIEVNPRPTAALQLFDGARARLFARHVAACLGRAPAPPGPRSQARALAVVYAEEASRAPRQAPSWAADWPTPGEIVAAGAPVATVRARGRTPEAARALAEARVAALKAMLVPAS